MSPADRDPQAPQGRVAALRAKYEPALRNLRSSETAKAAGLAGAMIANSVVALVSTFVFARELDDYGALNALISYLLILQVVGQALQVAAARESALGRFGSGRPLVETVDRWTRTMIFVTLGLTVVSIALQNPIAGLVGVKKYSWAAAMGIPAACVWLELSLLRGVLQGIGELKTVGISLIAEQTVRLITGAVLAAAFLGVSGAYLGGLISYVAMSVYCWRAIHQHGAEDKPVHGAVDLLTQVVRSWPAIAGLAVIAVLQNIDPIAAKHQFSKDTASAYSATAVAGKVLVWAAMGAGFYLVPEVSRRRAAGLDTRQVLFRALGIIGVCAVPVLLIFLGVPHLLLSVAFGPKRATASGSLIVLGTAFTVLAATYLAIQYLLALNRRWFLLPMALIAIAEPLILVQGPKNPSGFAVVVLAMQAAAAIVAFAFALWPGHDDPGSRPGVAEEQFPAAEPATAAPLAAPTAG